MNTLIRNFRKLLLPLYFLPFVIFFSFLPSEAGVSKDYFIFSPLSGVNFISGSQRIVGYFQKIENRCYLELFLARDVHLEEDFIFRTPVRIHHKAEAGQKLLVNSPEAKVLEFTCDKDALTMSVRDPDSKKINTQIAHTYLN